MEKRAYRYALHLTKGQEQALQRQEVQLRYAWNRMVNWHRCFMRDWRRGRQTQLLDEYREMLAAKNPNCGQASPMACRNRLLKNEAKRIAAAEKIEFDEAMARLVRDNFEPIVPSRADAIASKIKKKQHGTPENTIASAKKRAKEEEIRFEEALALVKAEGYGENGTGTGPRRLSVELAAERLQARADYFYGGMGPTLNGLVQKFTKSCEPWLKLKGTAQPPNYKKRRHKVAVQMQITSPSSCPVGAHTARGIGKAELRKLIIEADLSKLIGQAGKYCLVQWHRKMPEHSVVKQLAIAGRPGKRFLIVCFDCPRQEVLKPFAESTSTAGIDTGYRCALTVVSNYFAKNREAKREMLALDIALDQKRSADHSSSDGKALAGALASLERFLFTHDGIEEFQPRLARDYDFLKKLRRLQRKLDRQKRAANQECYNPDGTWKRGARAKHLTARMLDTHQQIQKMHERQADVRRDYYHLVAFNILKKHGHVVLADWRPPQVSKGPEPLPKGQAKKRRNANRKGLDHAISMFESILRDKAKLSANPRTVEVVEEDYTTQMCGCCKALTGPKEPTDALNWTCSACGVENHRKANAAENIRQRGQQTISAAPVAAVTAGAQPAAAQALNGH